MNERLIKLPTDQLLQKFGAGEHKPGSGSAAALQGMLSAKLLLTVIGLTTHEKRRQYYQDWLPELNQASTEIQSRIFPLLEKIFEDDSIQFDKTIKLRKARDSERNIDKRRELSEEALEELKIATETPVQIANLCIELAKFGTLVFDHGFRSARGDAGVAQNGAVAAVAGCISIINLNLLSFENSAWKEQVQKSVDRISFEYDKLLEETVRTSQALKEEVSAGNEFHKDIEALLNSIENESRLTNISIEETAKGVQNLLWKHRKIIWKRRELKSPIEALSAVKALESVLKFECFKDDTLGSYHSENGTFEIAGIIDPANRTVRISKAFSKETQNFTTAHELAHALFHKGATLHRDRPMDGSGSINVKDRREQQADKFAAYFLLPEKQVKNVFRELFGSDRFIIDDESVFALTSGNVRSFRSKIGDLRDLTRLIAAAGYFSGRSFTPLAEIFQVSVETMAIRLEELNLVMY